MKHVIPNKVGGDDNTLVFGYWLLQNVMGPSASNQAFVASYPSVASQFKLSAPIPLWLRRLEQGLVEVVTVISDNVRLNRALVRQRAELSKPLIQEWNSG